MQRTFVLSSGDIGVGLLRLRDCDLIQESDDAVELLVVPVQTGQIHLGQFAGSDLTRFDELREMRDRPERGVFQICGPAQTR